MPFARLVVLAVLSLSATTSIGGEPRSVAEALRAMDKSGAYSQFNHDESITGPDANRNGVRDDLDAWINSRPDTPEQKAALRQQVVALTAAMTVDSRNDARVSEVLRRIGNASACLHARYDSATASNKGAEVRKFTVNTKNRFMAYAAFNSAANGHSILLPRDSGCLN